MRITSLAFLFLGRSVRIAALTLLFVPAFLLHRVVAPGSGPWLLHWYLRSCGGAFVKAGQILAMRYDLLPLGYCTELSKLLDALPPVAFPAIRRVIEDDLGRPVAECFSEIDPVALASASIAQVHRGRLASGESVAVKVVRPGVRERFRIDLAYLLVFGRVLEGVGTLARLGPQRIVRELVQLTREELDFRREARNIDQMHRCMSRDDVDHCAPTIHLDLCGRSVITMEMLEGIAVNRVLEALDAGDHERLAAWAEMGITPENASRLLLRSVLEQAFRHRVFQADPHAANLILIPGGALGWVDFGMLGWLDERLWLHQIKLRQAVADGRIDAAYQHFLTTLEPLPATDLSSFEAEIKEYLRDWSAASESSTATIEEKSSGHFFLRVFDATRRARLRLPLGLTRLYRTVIISDIVMLKLDPRVDWVGVLREFLSDEQRRRLAALACDAASMDGFGAILESYVHGPRLAADMIARAQSLIPTIGRTYTQPPTRAERVLLLVLRYSRLAVVLGVGALIGTRLLEPEVLVGGVWEDVAERVSSIWGYIAVGLLAGVLLGRLIRELEKPD